MMYSRYPHRQVGPSPLIAAILMGALSELTTEQMFPKTVFEIPPPPVPKPLPPGAQQESRQKQLKRLKGGSRKDRARARKVV